MTLTEMPDIANEEKVALQGTLDKVGMKNIEIPVRVINSSGQEFFIPSICDAFVSLDDPDAKGIHMSRLYLAINEAFAQRILNLSMLKDLLIQFQDSHSSISKSSYIKVKFDLMEQRQALKSDNKGWRTYPVEYQASYKKGQFIFELGVEVIYSSTCPCSAALARQLIQQGFREKFSSGSVDTSEVYRWLGTQEGISATPHSQRSSLKLKVQVSHEELSLTPMELVDLSEQALGTPVQAVVKREDEQEFARLNGQNLMFCEDAGRKIKKALESEKRIVDYRAQVNHVESLHPHDAVSIVTKGVESGYQV